MKQLLEAERTGGSYLALRDGHGALVMVGLDAGEPARMIGRRPGMALWIDWDSEVSNVHAELQCVGGEWTILDDGLSRNGTFVNGERISGRRRLQAGDRIRVGRTVLAYVGRARPEAERTTPPTGGPPLPRLTEAQRRVLIALCVPYGTEGRFATPASNQQIAESLYLSIDAVKMHLRRLFQLFELSELPQYEKRARLAESALQLGVITHSELG